METKPQSSARCCECGSELLIARRACRACGLQLEAELPYPRLARLGAAERRLIEDFLLTAGNLSQLARDYGVSRPTMRQRIDSVIRSVRELRAADAARSEELLAGIETGRLTPEAAARTLRELQA